MTPGSGALQPTCASPAPTNETASAIAFFVIRASSTLQASKRSPRKAQLHHRFFVIFLAPSITDAAGGLDGITIRTEPFSQSAYVGVERARIRVRVDSPHDAHQVGPREDDSRGGHHRGEE